MSRHCDDPSSPRDGGCLVVVLDARGRIRDCNEGCQKRAGLPRSGVLGRRFRDLFPGPGPDPAAGPPDSLFRTQDTGGWLRWEVFQGAGEGWVLHGIPEPGKEDSPPQRDWAPPGPEELFSQAGDPVFLLDPEGQVQDTNRGGEALLGLASGDVAGRHFSELVPPEERPQVAQHLEEVRDRGQSRLDEGRIRTSSGDLVWVEITYSHVLRSSRPVILVILRDIRARKHAESALQHRLALESLLAGISNRFLAAEIEDLSGKIQTTLEELGQFAGSDRSLLLLYSDDRDKVDQVHEWCAPGIPSRLDQVRGMPVGHFGWSLAGHHRDRPFRLTRLEELPPEAEAEREALKRLGIRSQLWVPLRMGGELAGALGLIAIRTEVDWEEADVRLLWTAGEILAAALHRRRCEAHRQRLQETIERKRRSLAVTEVASILAERVNQPLSAASTYAYGCLQAMDGDSAAGSEEIRKHLGEVSVQILYAGKIINGLRDFLRRPPRSRSQAVSDLVQGFLDRHWPVLTGTADHLELDLAPDLPAISCDPDQIREVLANLVTNALEAMESSGAPDRDLTIGARSGGGHVEIWVADRGPGLPPALREDPFQPLFSTKTQGPGLGLSLSRSLVEGHGGAMWATEPPGGGTSIHFTLPVAGPDPGA